VLTKSREIQKFLGEEKGANTAVKKLFYAEEKNKC
jgi:hypothetical protein